MTEPTYNIGVHMMGRESTLFFQCRDAMRTKLLTALTPDDKNYVPLFVTITDIEDVELHIRRDQILSVSSELIDRSVIRGTLTRGTS